MKLFRAELTYEVVVLARDWTHAIEVAEDQAREIVLNEEPGIDAGFLPITKLHHLPDPEWRKALPYSDDADQERTCEDWLTNPDPPSDAELEAAGQLTVGL